MRALQTDAEALGGRLEIESHPGLVSILLSELAL
jgi:hypothetical protein